MLYIYFYVSFGELALLSRQNWTQYSMLSLQKLMQIHCITPGDTGHSSYSFVLLFGCHFALYCILQRFGKGFSY